MFIDENSKPKEKLKAWYLFTEDFVAGTRTRGVVAYHAIV